MIDLIDDLEAGELSVEFEGREPWELLEWALERFCAADRPLDRLPDRRRRADRHGLRARPVDPASSASTPAGCRSETFELVEQLRERYPGLRPRAPLTATPRHVQAMVGRHGPNLFYRQVEHRLLCCNVRKVQPLDAPPGDARRLDHRPPPRPVGDADGHPQDRDRPRPRRDRQAQPARRVDGGRGLGLRPRARRSVPPALRPRLHLDRLRSVHARRSRPGRRAATGAGGGRRTRRKSAASTARSRPAGSSTSCER